MDNGLLDANYPDMSEWGQAGLGSDTKGDDTKERISLKPGDDLAAAVAQPNRIVQLAPGDYRITQALRFANNVLLKGAGIGRTKLISMLRGTRPTVHDETNFMPWTSSLLLQSVESSGIENLSVYYDDTLPPPPNPKEGDRSYADNPDGRDDLHVVAVRLSGCRNCWLSNVEIKNSGQHPLMLESSSQITIDGVQIEGAYNKGDGSGNLLISGSDHCLITGLQAGDINHISFTNDPQGTPSRYNVIVNSRIAVDVRFRNPEGSHNLLQECVIEVPAWHNFPPISIGWNGTNNNEHSKSNLIYFCTITRDFISGRSRFSVADNPNQVYYVLANSTLKGNVEAAGPAPKASTLWPVH